MYLQKCRYLLDEDGYDHEITRPLLDFSAGYGSDRCDCGTPGAKKAMFRMSFGGGRDAQKTVLYSLGRGYLGLFPLNGYSGAITG
jgi:hypothetical protein